ncbi:MAG: Type pilus biosis and competence protein pilQ precursor [Pseudomonadota bacterium]|jgi:type IV pilus assembly protein PilQ
MNQIVRLFHSCLLALVLLLGLVPLRATAQAGSAQVNAIERIESSAQGGNTLVTLTLSQAPAAAPGLFLISNPNRLVLDFVGTDNGMGNNLVRFGAGEARTAQVVQASGRTRVVFNLQRAVTHAVRLEGRTVQLTLAPVASSDPSSAAYRLGAGESGAVHSVREIDFRRGPTGEGRVVVELSDASAGVDIRQQGQQLLVDFQRTRLPEALRRKLDVGDFGTPVRSVSSFEQGDLTRLVIEPAGQWEHSAYQSDSRLVIEVRAVRADPSRPAGAVRPGYNGEKLSLNFQNVDVRALLQVIADFTNLNIVVRESVTGNLTLRLKDVPWDQALDIVLQAKDLGMRRNGNVIVVAPAKEMADQLKAEHESRKEIAAVEPTRVETFKLNYQKAESVQKLLSDEKQRVLSKSGSAVFDERTNTVFVRDTASQLEEVRRIIGQLDVPVRQVLIEARIVEADDGFSRNLGIKWGLNDLRSTVAGVGTRTDPVTGAATAVNVPVYGPGSALAGSNLYSTVSGNLQGAVDLSSQAGSSLSGTNLVGLGRPTAVGNTNFVNLPAAAINGVNPASVAISLFGSSLTRFINLELSALEADQRGKVVSSPRVLTGDKSKAIIEQGTELPYQAATSSGATQVQFKKASLKLEVTPQITPEGTVIMKVAVNRDAVGQLTPAGFAINTRAVQTEVLVENGGTVVIGGIYEQTEINRVNKVPLLGDVPYVGSLFRSTSRTSNKTELLVFLTPRVVTDTAMAR